jgi:hypothetical protein
MSFSCSAATLLWAVADIVAGDGARADVGLLEAGVTADR